MSNEVKKLQYQCALNSFRAQFHQAIELAKGPPQKPVVLKTCAVGMGVFGNDPKIVAQALKNAALEFGPQLKAHNVTVRLQIFKSEHGADVNASYVADQLNLNEHALSEVALPNVPSNAPTEVAPALSINIPREKTTLFGLKSHDLIELRNNLISLKTQEGASEKQQLIKFSHMGNEHNVYINPDNQNILIFQPSAAAGVGFRGAGGHSQNEKLGINLSDEGDILSVSWNDVVMISDPKNQLDVTSFYIMKDYVLKVINTAGNSIKEQVATNKPVAQLSKELTSALLRNMQLGNQLPIGDSIVWKVQAQEMKEGRLQTIQDKYVINIQNSNAYAQGLQTQKTGLQISNDGSVEHIIIDSDFSQPKKIISTEVVNTLETAAFMLGNQTTANASDGSIKIDIDRKILTDGYANNLSKFGEAIDRVKLNPNPRINVKFLHEQGYDANGLSREYVSLLFKGLLGGSSSCVKMIPRGAGGALSRPGTAKSYNPNGAENNHFPKLDEGEQKNFMNLGMTMMFCLRSNNGQQLTTGKYFDESLFAAIKTLTPDEIGLDTKEIRLKIAESLEASENSEIKLNLLKQKLKSEDMNAIEIDHLKAYAEALFDFDPDDTKSIPKNILFLYQDTPLSKNTLEKLIDDILLLKYCREIPPVQAIAQGMYNCGDSNPRQFWNENIRSKPAAEISRRIQGTTDRQALKNSIRSGSDASVRFGNFSNDENNPYILKLKDWIVNPSTKEEEIEQFLQFITGSRAMSLNSNIDINFANLDSNAAFISHTCFNRLDVNNTVNFNSPENFIVALKAAMGGTGGYGTA